MLQCSLFSFTNFKADEVSSHIGGLKLAVVIAQLSALRASTPQIPLNSTLDLVEPQVPASQPVDSQTFSPLPLVEEDISQMLGR